RLASTLADDAEPFDPLLEELEPLRVGQQAQLARASRLLREDRTAEALQLTEQLTRDYPASASAWLGLGRTLVQAKEYKKAMLVLRSAEQRDPTRADTAFYLGVALFEQGLPADAAAHFRRAT